MKTVNEQQTGTIALSSGDMQRIQGALSYMAERSSPEVSERTANLRDRIWSDWSESNDRA